MVADVCAGVEMDAIVKSIVNAAAPVLSVGHSQRKKMIIFK